MCSAWAKINNIGIEGWQYTKDVEGVIHIIYWYKFVGVKEETATDAKYYNVTIVNNYANEIDNAVIDSNIAVAVVDVTVHLIDNVVDHIIIVMIHSTVVNDILAID